MDSLASRFRIVLLGTLWAFGAAAGDFSFTITGESFSYSDAERSFGGLIIKPEGQGPFPAIVFDHGQGGSPTTYPNLQVMRDWGAVVIAPTLSHVAGGETAPATTGHCPESLARGLAVVAALERLDFVDPQRLAVFGHSKGAYAAIGQVAELGTRVRVAAMTAGGILPDSAGVNQAAPTYSEAASVSAPFLMFHGNIDSAVPPERSLDFSQRLSAAQVPNQRVVFEVGALNSSLQHNLHQVPEINAQLLAQTQAWFAQWQLFEPGLLVDGFEMSR